ncbi:MAG: hypothetical protein ACO1OY_07140 [Ramlibacter sp.]
MLRKLIAFAITSGLAKKAWDHYKAERRPYAVEPRDITDVVARPAASADPSRRGASRRMGARRRSEGPSA